VSENRWLRSFFLLSAGRHCTLPSLISTRSFLHFSSSSFARIAAPFIPILRIAFMLSEALNNTRFPSKIAFIRDLVLFTNVSIFRKLVLPNVRNLEQFRASCVNSPSFFSVALFKEKSNHLNTRLNVPPKYINIYYKYCPLVRSFIFQKFLHLYFFPQYF
jgi:hypothetical protein